MSPVLLRWGLGCSICFLAGANTAMGKFRVRSSIQLQNLKQHANTLVHKKATDSPERIGCPLKADFLKVLHELKTATLHRTVNKVGGLEGVGGAVKAGCIKWCLIEAVKRCDQEFLRQAVLFSDSVRTPNEALKVLSTETRNKFTVHHPWPLRVSCGCRLFSLECSQSWSVNCKCLRPTFATISPQLEIFGRSGIL